MAKGSNPPHIAGVLKELLPLTVGLELAGAGGGGFIVAILHRTINKAKITNKVKDLNESMISKDVGELVLYDVDIDIDVDVV